MSDADTIVREDAARYNLSDSMKSHHFWWWFLGSAVVIGVILWLAHPSWVKNDPKVPTSDINWWKLIGAALLIGLVIGLIAMLFKV